MWLCDCGKSYGRAIPYAIHIGGCSARKNVRISKMEHPVESEEYKRLNKFVCSLLPSSLPEVRRLLEAGTVIEDLVRYIEMRRQYDEDRRHE